MSESFVRRCRSCSGRRELSRDASSGRGFGASAGTGPKGGPTVAADLRELVASLEAELEGSAKCLESQAQRVAAEAEYAMRALAASRSGSQEQGGNATERQQSRELTVQRTCSFWLEQERLRRERSGLPQDSLAPCTDWGEERTQYQAAARAAESKFAQLSKLRRVLQARRKKSSRM